MTSNRANVDASLNLLVAARDAGVKRVVYAGSSSAYGDTPTLPKREDMPTAPLSPYALQKLVAEKYCRMFTRLYGLETVTIRYFNVFGPRQDPSSPYSGVISLFVSALALGDRPRSTATASRPATSRTLPTSWTACSVPAAPWRERGSHQRRHRRTHLAQPALPDDPRSPRRSVEPTTPPPSR